MSVSRKKVVILSVVALAVVTLSAFTIYAINTGDFSPAESVSNILYPKATEPPTQPPTQPTDPELDAKISSQKLSVKDNTSATITATIKGNQQGGYNIRYTTSDENIAYIDTKGNITPKSAGECQVGVYIEGYDNSLQNFSLQVQDERMQQIQTLNSYLFGLPYRQEYFYANNKKGIAKMTGCRIEDINQDGNYELIIRYNLSDMLQKVFVITSDDTDYYINQSNINFDDIANGNFSSYSEEVYVDESQTISILSESTRTVNNFTEKRVSLYNVGMMSAVVSEYFSKEPLNLFEMNKKAQYSINNEPCPRDDFLWQYSALKSAREMFEDYVGVTASLSQGKYVKAELPSDIGQSYYNRLKWTSSDTEVAEVNDTGMITGRSKMGNCDIIGYIEGYDTPFCKVSVDVSDISSDFDGYVEMIKDKEIIGSAGNKMRLYGYCVMDIDRDNVQDLLLYYVGGNGCQLEFAHYFGSQVNRQIVKSIVTENGTSCMFDLYEDMMNNEIVLYVGKVTKTDDAMKNDFHYENFIGGQFVDNGSSLYSTTSFNSGKSEYRVADSVVDSDSFNAMVSRYQKTSSWKLVA